MNKAIQLKDNTIGPTLIEKRPINNLKPINKPAIEIVKTVFFIGNKYFKVMLFIESILRAIKKHHTING